VSGGSPAVPCRSIKARLRVLAFRPTEHHIIGSCSGPFPGRAACRLEAEYSLFRLCADTEVAFEIR
jgi:hypothetical protein